MKKVIITCDTCKKEIGENYIRLGSENETELSFDNNLKTKVGQTKSLRRYRDLHFCSKEHFFTFFFNDK